MKQEIITITLRGESAEKLRKAQENPSRIDWSGFSRLLKDGARDE